MKRRPLALTTGQAAKYCFVTSDTIVNWIKSGTLTAQRTVGGQYRILLEDMRSFMGSRGMSTRLLDQETGTRMLCWQFHAEQNRGGRPHERCEGCIVRSLGVLHCYKLMGMRPGEESLRADCTDCDYYAKWADRADENGGTVIPAPGVSPD